MMKRAGCLVIERAWLLAGLLLFLFLLRRSAPQSAEIWWTTKIAPAQGKVDLNNFPVRKLPAISCMYPKPWRQDS